jgi:agmatinase
MSEEKIQHPSSASRRNFLKVGGAAALGLLVQQAQTQDTFNKEINMDQLSSAEILDLLEYSVPFAGLQTFMKLPYSRKPEDVAAADMVIMGVPFDSGTFNRSGSRLGPRAIREQSYYATAFEPMYPWNYTLREKFKMIDFGDVVSPPGTGAVETMLELTEAVATEVFKAGKSLLTLGGDHTLPIGIVRGAAKQYGPVALVHIDAHQDSYDAEELGSDQKIYNHGVFATELVKEGHIDPSKSSQVYIRTIQPASPKGGYDVVYANDALALAPEALAARVKARVGTMPVYISLDVDGLDPAFTPGNGSPVAGGPSSGEMRRFLKALDGLNVIGADVVEVNPLYDPTQATAIIAATLAVDLLYLMGNARG